MPPSLLPRFYNSSQAFDLLAILLAHKEFQTTLENVPPLSDI